MSKEKYPLGLEPADQERIKQLETKKQAELGRIALTTDNLNLAGADLAQTEAEMLHIQFKQEAADIRACEQVFSDELSWYVPLEEIVGIPLIGMDADEFLAAIEGHSKYIKAIKSREGPKRLGINIESEHTRKHYNIRGAGVGVYILPDNSLRPQKIYNYDRIFAYDPKDLGNGTTIHLIGRSNRWYGYDYDCTDTDTETMQVDRFINGGLGGKHQRGRIETYNRQGKKIATRDYRPDYSRELC